ncbi:MAG: DUF4214 domain-containing protein [Rhizobiaceae bacterium]|nr:DUF4214 domain-containing protein [Rhizobiaceae bacterium]
MTPHADGRSALTSTDITSSQPAGISASTATQALFDDGRLVFLAEMAQAAYGTVLPTGLSATTLPSASGGLYVGGTNGAAVAMVGRSDDALFVAFRGTDDDTDISYWSQTATYYEFFRPLINDIAGLLASDPSIRHVYVTGHSLGGAMAQMLVANDGWWPGVDVEGVTFASLGGAYGPDQPDDRITNIVIEQDFIRLASGPGVVLGDEYIIDDRNTASNGGLYYHSMDNYVAAARYLTQIGIFPHSPYAGNGTAEDVSIAANLVVQDGAPVLYDYHGTLPAPDAGEVRVFTTDQGGDSFTGTSALDVVNFDTGSGTNVFVDVGNGYAGSDGWPQATTFTGIQNVMTGSGDDTIVGSGSSNWLSGGEGRDTVVYGASRGEAGVWTTGDSSLAVSVYGVTDTLVGIERVQFTDGVLLFDLDSENASFAYRIYAAAYGRTPDEAGLRFWTDALDQRGGGLPDQADKEFAASFFLTANEFSDVYGQNPTNEQYIDRLYENVLHRGADQAGYDFWLGVIDNGHGRDDMLIWFTDSDENVANTAPDFDYGIWVL